MNLDYQTLEALRLKHPAWSLLRADSAPLVVSFLHRAFIVPNLRSCSQSDLVEKLEDQLFALRQGEQAERFPRSAQAYLDEWAQDDKAWLRKYYPPGSDEPSFDLTPATEKVIGWLNSLTERAFVGTESRMLMVFELLRQMVEGAENDPEARIRELEKRRQELADEIARIRAGHLAVLDETALKDRFQQLVGTARDLLGDFREVEQNFRQLDRRVRERIALWDGAKGQLLDEILGERDAITDSDQGRSFRAFWDFLMSQARQEELSQLLDRVLQLPAVSSLRPDGRLRRIHYDWLTAGEHTQRTVSTLSQQLRRLLDDQAFLENRRIMEIIHHLEGRAVEVREHPPAGDFFAVDDLGANLELPMERPLFTPPLKPTIADQVLEESQVELDTEALFTQLFIDKARLAACVRQSLGARHQVSLAEVVEEHPLQHGLAELVAYLSLASESPRAVFDRETEQRISWEDPEGQRKVARLPRVLFVR